jgi:serine/threonine-protein kinase
MDDDELPTEALAAGRVIAGNFRVERLLGEGAMGQVYLAEQLSLGKKVAIKVLHRHLARDPALAKRFQREAKSASQLNHTNSIQIIDFGQDADGALFIAMELLDGRDLGKLIRTDFPLPLARVVRIMGQVFGALDEAHVHGVIHRDLKPENVMVTDRRGEPDFVKVCDFGIAKIQDPKSDAPESMVTMAGVVCGTPEYMSPEQARGETLDGRTDLYSAAVMLYQMATGELPFTAGSALGVVTKHLTDAPAPPRRRRPDLAIHPAFEALILRGLEKDRARRPASALDFKRELEAVLVEAAASPAAARSTASAMRPHAAVIATAPTIAAGTAQSVAAAIAPGAADEVGDAPAPSRRGPLVLGAVAAVAVAGAVVLTLALGGRPRTPPAPAPVAAPIVAPPASPPVVAAAAAPDAAAAPHAERPAAPAHPPKPEGGRPRPERKTAEAKPPRPEAKVAPPAPVKAAPTPAGPRGFKEILADAEAALRGGRARQAVQLLEEARGHSPGNAKVHRLLGKGYNLTGRSADASKAYKRYLELAPNAADADVVRAMIK